MFDKRDSLIVLKNSDKPLVVIGAPHQAPSHTGKICTPKRTSDIDSGVLAKDIFDKLDVPAKLVIMNEAQGIDPNKDITTPYSKEVLNSGARVLLEIHGQSDRNKHPLEFSAGRNDISKISTFGLMFYEELLKEGELLSFAVQEKKDSKDAIVFTKDRILICDELVLPALQSILIDKTEDYNISAIHLETMPRFRYGDGRIYLSLVLSKTVKRFLGG